MVADSSEVAWAGEGAQGFYTTIALVLCSKKFKIANLQLPLNAPHQATVNLFPLSFEFYGSCKAARLKLDKAGHKRIR